VSLTPIAILGLLLWAGICAADQRALGARQLHQPIVAAAGAGILLHAPERALLVGLWFQLVWVAPMPIGGVLLADTGSAAIAATIVAVAVAGPAGLGAALLVGLVVGSLSIPWERALRAGNGRIERDALGLDRPGGGQIGIGSRVAASGSTFGVSGGIRDRSGRALDRAIIRGIAGPFMRGVLCAGIAMLCALFLAARVGGSVPSLAIALQEPWPIERAVLGGAICVGLAGLFLRVRTETGRAGTKWMIGGALLGLAGGIVLAGGRG
jgi:hypothetical protein